jgi:drug/metabolite transporter (DMT)-like permease
MSRFSAGSALIVPAIPRWFAPVLALLLSTFVEDYRWSVLAIAGLALVAAGNVLVLTGKRS